jgi:hypothetical protein
MEDAAVAKDVRYGPLSVMGCVRTLVASRQKADLLATAKIRDKNGGDAKVKVVPPRCVMATAIVFFQTLGAPLLGTATNGMSSAGSPGPAARRKQPVCILPHARARERVVPIFELVFGTLTQNRSSLEPSLGFAAIAGTPRIVDRARYVQVLPRAR